MSCPDTFSGKLGSCQKITSSVGFDLIGQQSTQDIKLAESLLCFQTMCRPDIIESSFPQNFLDKIPHIQKLFSDHLLHNYGTKNYHIGCQISQLYFFFGFLIITFSPIFGRGQWHLEPGNAKVQTINTLCPIFSLLSDYHVMF